MMFYSLAIFTCCNDSCCGNGRREHNWQDVFRDASVVEFEEVIPLPQMVKNVESDTDADILMYADASILFSRRRVWNLIARVSEQDPKELRGDFLMLGRQSGGSACYFFRRGMFHDLPPNVAADDVLVLAEYCLACNIPVIDASLILGSQPSPQSRCDEPALFPVSHTILRDGRVVSKRLPTMCSLT